MYRQIGCDLLEKLKLIGFHATSKERAHNILAEGFLINRKRNNDWLGHGIYLFMYEIDAKSWANKTYYCKDNPAIIKCVVEVENDKYKDLDNPEEMNNYSIYFNEILNTLSQNNKSIVFKDNYEAMCWGLNIYKKDNSIDVIKYTFTNNRTRSIMKYGNSKFGYKHNEIQICISKNEVILKKDLCS